LSRTVRMTCGVLVTLFWVLAGVTLFVGIGARLAPAFGHQLLAIRSGSMEPNLPLGALALVSTGADHAPQLNDEIAFRLPSGAIVTHRIVQVVARDDGTYYRTKGDANAAPDPVLTPETALVGRVVLGLPLLGYLLAFLGMPLGILSIISVAGCLISAIWLLENLEDRGAPGSVENRQPVATTATIRAE
jgi:signal peptidase